MSDLVDRLVQRVISGDTPESDIMALGSDDLENLATGLEQRGADSHDVRRVYEVLERGCGECTAFARGLSLAYALELGELPSARAIVVRLRIDQPAMPPLVIDGARAARNGGTTIDLNASQLVAIASRVSELDGLYVRLPVEASIEVSGEKIVSSRVEPLDSETLQEAQSFVETLFVRGEIGFTEPLPAGVSHHVVVDGQGRRVLERFRFVN